MDRDRLRELLRVRTECLRVPDEILDRALARCARLEARAQRNGVSARSQASRTAISATGATATGATVPSLGDAPAAPPGGATVPSLGDAPAAPPADEPPPQRSGALPAGRIIAGYRIESLLGKGGMGAVYRAIQLSMARPVAFKVLAPRLASDPTFVGRFKREARAAGRLHHPNLITVHEAGEAAGLVFFSMELVEGTSLKEMIRQQGRIPPPQALAIARQVLEALRFAHAKGVIHRDIKPDNIMVTAAGQAKIADLGLSRIEEGHATETTELFKTEAGSFMGTPHYMAPEQCRDAHAADARADLYALGATMFHMVCGKPPFDGATPMEVMVAAQKAPLVFPDPPLPKPLREFIARLMEKEAAKRPADAATALAQLDRIIGPPPQPTARKRPWWRRLVGLAAWSAAALAVAAMVLFALSSIAERERERDWQAVLAAAQADVDALHWNLALDRLNQARPGLDAARAASCDEASTRFTAAWDTWAVGQFTATERKYRDMLAAGRFSEIFELLKAVPAIWRSPAVERRIDDLLVEAGEAAGKAAERKRDGDQAPGLQGLLEMRDRRRKLSAETWQRATIEPAGSARSDDAGEILTGSGSARVPIPGNERLPLLDIALHLVWRRSDPTARLTIALGGGAQAVITPNSAVLEVDGRQSPLAGDGQSLHMIRRDGRLAVLTRSGDSLVPVRIDPGPELRLRWQLGTAELAASFGGGKRGP